MTKRIAAMVLVAAFLCTALASLLQAEGGVAPLSVTVHDPPVHEVGVALTRTVQATFDHDVDMGTVTSDTFVVHGHLGGLAGGTFSYDGGTRTMTLYPDRAFHAGEVLRVSATGGISSTAAAGMTPYGWQFTAGPVANRYLAGFVDTGAALAGVDASSAAWGDYNNDGDLDILLAGHDGSAHVSKVYRNDGAASGYTDIHAGLIGVSFSSVAWGDCDNDGDLDILLTGNTGSTEVSKVYRNDGPSGFSEIAAGLTGVTIGSSAWGDYDNDGDLDILLTGASAGGAVSTVYRNDGPLGFTDIGAALAGVVDSSVAWGDYDNDGDLDILLAGNSYGTFVSKVYRNDTPSGFVDISAALTGVVLGSLAWGDYDNDGDLDILLTGQSSTGLVSQVYRNEGAGVFTDIAAGLTAVHLSAVAWGDADNDGDLDILLSGFSPGGEVSKVYRNEGAGAFIDTGAGLNGTQLGSVSWGDCDDDGDLDILLTGSRMSMVYRNNSAPELGPVTPSSGSSAVGATTYFTTTWSDPDGWENLKQCYFHIGASPALAGNVTLLYNAAKDKLWLLEDAGTTWQGGCHPGAAATVDNSQAALHCSQTAVQGVGDTLAVRWAIEFKPGFEGAKKLGLKCKDRDRAKAKGRWKGTWTITP